MELCTLTGPNQTEILVIRDRGEGGIFEVTGLGHFRARGTSWREGGKGASPRSIYRGYILGQFIVN